ncbi:hypothetical protein [Methylobacterium durans]|uniref:Tetratricopeptide repeat protein n=1 Tax=Methylobacterium durans TaxID=2202825 RepID=A0A2U8W237_9HYPH|nr:hypothetical protein [Methylobacterium durans]AWN40137.1 hypothetical protein DK389_05775 [Methylobacterium durans]
MSSAPRSGYRRAPAALALLVAGWAAAASAAPAADGSEDVRPGSATQTLVLSRDVIGEPGAPIPLAIEVRRLPDRSNPSTYLLGLPKGARLADSLHAITAQEEKSIVEVTDWNLPELSITLLPQQIGTFTLAVAALSRAENGEPLRLARSTFTLNVQPREAPVPIAQPSGQAALRPDVGASAPVVTANLKETASQVYVPQLPAIAPLEARLAEMKPPAPATHPDTAGPPPVGPAPGTAKPPSPAMPPTAAKAASPSEPSPQALVERAERLIQLGDISGARLVLERAMDRGEPRAAFLLAQTCDPRMLRAWKVQGLQADPERARALYARAAREGLGDPKSLAEAMR